MAGYTAATQNYNDMVMKISNDWATFVQLQARRLGTRGRPAPLAV